MSEGCRERVAAQKAAQRAAEEAALRIKEDKERRAEMAKPDSERVFLAARRAAMEQMREEELLAAEKAAEAKKEKDELDELDDEL